MQGTQKAQRVLIIEEDRVEAGIVAFHLRRAGYKPLLVSSSDEATDAVAWGTPDAVVAELGGTGINGLEFANSLAGSSLVFLLVADRVLTGEEQLAALRLGLHHVLQKPIDPDALVDRLRRSSPRDIGPPPGTADGEIRGSLGDRSVVELVRLASRHGIDCHLNVASEGPDGWLLMRSGQIIDATLGDKMMKDAAVDMLLRDRGQFVLKPLPAEAPELQRHDSVQCDLAQLLAEAMAKATPGRLTDPGIPTPTAAAVEAESDDEPRLDTHRGRSAKSRQVGIPGQISPRVTLPDAADPRPQAAPAEPEPEPEAQAAAPAANLPWWKPPPLKGFQAPRASTARRRGSRLKLDTKPRVRTDAEAHILAQTEPPRSVTASKRSTAQAGSYVRQPTGPQPTGAAARAKIKPITQPGGAVSEISAPPSPSDDQGRGRIITRPGIPATDPSEALLAELGPPRVGPDIAVPGRRNAGPRISKGSPRVLAGAPRGRLKPPPFRRPSPPGPPPSDTAEPAAAGVPAAPPQAPEPKIRKRPPRRFQTAGRMKAIEPNADLVAAYQEFKDEHGLKEEEDGGSSAPARPNLTAVTPPVAPVVAPPTTPPVEAVPAAANVAPSPEPVAPQVTPPSPPPEQPPEPAAAPPPVAAAPPRPPQLPADDDEPIASEPAPARAEDTEKITDPELAAADPLGVAAAAAAAVSAGETAPELGDDVDADAPPISAAADAERVRGRLVPRSFFADGERPVRKLRRTSHPNLKAAGADAVETQQNDAITAADIAAANLEAPKQRAAQTRATDPPFPSLEPPADPRATDRNIVVEESLRAEPGYSEEEPEPDLATEPGIALTGLTAAPPSQPRGSTGSLNKVIWGLAAVLVAVLGLVGWQLATKPGGKAPKPGVAAKATPGPSFDERLGAATLALENDKIEAAERMFGALAKERPSNLSAASGWATTLFRLRRWKEAQPAFENLKKLAPNNANVYWHLVYVYGANGDKKAANEAADTFTKLSPENSPEAKKIQAELERP